jgi:MFS family permease
MLVSALLMGIGLGLSFAALGNLIVQAVPPEQTGVASGVNTVMRTLGGALGGQLSATFIASNIAASGLPTVTGFTESFWMATGFLALCFVAGMLVPKALGRNTPPAPPPSALADDDLLKGHPGRVAA